MDLGGLVVATGEAALRGHSCVDMPIIRRVGNLPGLTTAAEPRREMA